jgi:hypothetical protein
VLVLAGEALDDAPERLVVVEAGRLRGRLAGGRAATAA